MLNILVKAHFYPWDVVIGAIRTQYLLHPPFDSFNDAYYKKGEKFYFVQDVNKKHLKGISEK